jgi:uncharacterized membrane protein YeiH
MTRYLLEHFAVMFSAATGALAARGKSVDLFGVVVLGMVTAVGGGTLRDVLLDVPVFWIRDSSYIVWGVTASLLSFVVARYTLPPRNTLAVIDAFGLALVTMLGTAKTLQHGHAAAVCVVLGVTSGVAGGILRDVLSGEIPLVFRTNIYLYATAAMCGSLVFLGVSHLQPGQPANLLIGAGVVLALRLAALKWRLHLPEFRTPE